MSEEEKVFSLKIDTPSIKIDLKGSNEFIENMFNIIIEDFLVQQGLIGIIEEEEEEEEDLDEEEIKEIEKIEKDITGVSLDEFTRNYKFEKPQEKLIITALWLTKIKKIKELNNAYINRVLDNSGFKKIDHIAGRLAALRNKKMITIISAPTGKRKTYKLAKEDIAKIEKTYKLDQSSEN